MRAQTSAIGRKEDASTFHYRALRPEGGFEKGQLQAADQDAALATLAARGLFPVTVSARRPTRAVFAPRIGPADLAIGFRILATVLDSGLAVRRAAAVFAMLAPPTWKPVIAVLLPTLREGRGLSAALVESDVSIPPEIIGMLRAGEAGGTVPAALRAAADYSQTSAATRSAIRAALAYPALLGVAAAASIGVLVTVVLPRFATILSDLNQALPPTTRVVLNAASMVDRIAIPTMMSAILAGILFRLWLTRPAARITFDGALLRLPVIGGLRHAACTGRACAALSALLEAGVSISPALKMTAAAAGDAAISDRIVRARDAVIRGQGLGLALAESAAFTAASLRLIRAGEETGQLAPMLAHAAQLERDRATEGVRRLVRLLEPTLILLFAGLVALVGAALMQAVYSVRPT